MIDGLSRKQTAQRLSLSPNTVHVYIKQLYSRFGVASATEILAQFIDDGVRDRLR